MLGSSNLRPASISHILRLPQRPDSSAGLPYDRQESYVFFVISGSGPFGFSLPKFDGSAGPRSWTWQPPDPSHHEIREYAVSGCLLCRVPRRLRGSIDERSVCVGLFLSCPFTADIQCRTVLASRPVRSNAYVVDATARRPSAGCRNEALRPRRSLR